MRNWCSSIILLMKTFNINYNTIILFIKNNTIILSVYIFKKGFIYIYIYIYRGSHAYYILNRNVLTGPAGDNFFNPTYFDQLVIYFINQKRYYQIGWTLFVLNYSSRHGTHMKQKECS